MDVGLREKSLCESLLLSKYKGFPIDQLCFLFPELSKNEIEGIVSGSDQDSEEGVVKESSVDSVSPSKLKIKRFRT